MRLPLFQLDAFADGPFSGNPAAVCMVDDWPTAALMQAIAAENNLSETAFIRPRDEGYGLRWFTPVAEVSLCGHATLASAYVVLNVLDQDANTVHFDSPSGRLTVRRDGERLELDFPAWTPRPLAADDARFQSAQEALGQDAEQAWSAAEDLLFAYPNEVTLRALRPDFPALARIDCRGVITTCPGQGEIDFLSRFFAPAVGVNEDPVTGSAHCALTPYWSKRLRKRNLIARQLSSRGGILWCRDGGERVYLSGRVLPYLEGTISV